MSEQTPAGVCASFRNRIWSRSQHFVKNRTRIRSHLLFSAGAGACMDVVNMIAQVQILLNFGCIDDCRSLNRSRIHTFKKISDSDMDSNILEQERSRILKMWPDHLCCACNMSINLYVYTRTYSSFVINWEFSRIEHNGSNKPVSILFPLQLHTQQPHNKIETILLTLCVFTIRLYFRMFRSGNMCVRYSSRTSSAEMSIGLDVDWTESGLWRIWINLDWIQVVNRFTKSGSRQDLDWFNGKEMRHFGDERLRF